MIDINRLQKTGFQKRTMFLLGGHDLEMISIKKLLLDFGFEDISETADLSCDLCFADFTLTWSDASIASYKKFLNYSGIIYGIELFANENIKLPEQYHRIDHHNDFSDKPSAIEQVLAIISDIPVQCQNSMLQGKTWLPKNSLIAIEAEKLKLEPIQFIKLVAANDTGHIAGMRNIEFSTDDMIKSIRFLDRQAQGITEEQWQQGEKAINESLKRNKDVCIVKALHNHFSVVTDRLDEKKLIVYDDKQLMYYGTHARKLPEIFAENIAAKNAFYGGSDENGFFGFTNGTIKPEKMDAIINKIVDFVANQEPISHHIFLMPFQWDYFKYDKKDKPENIFDIPFKERSSLAGIIEIMEGNLSDSFCNQSTNYHKCWKRYYMNFDSAGDFNEYTYFYNHVREALFDRKDGKIEDKTLLQYEYNIPCNLQYVINIKKANAIKEYKLAVENITLNFYDSGVGVFAFHLTNNTYYELDDILNINDFGRRIYPQYISDQPDMLSNVKGNFLADSIVLSSEEANFNICECFDYYTNLSRIAEKKIELPKHIQCLLGNKFTTKVLPKQETGSKIQMKPVIDDRMFVLCWYGNDNLVQKLVRHKPKTGNNDIEYNYENSPEWHKLIFVDNGDATVKNSNMLNRLCKAHTYERWTDNKTLYGISRYSFIMLTDTDWFPKNILLRHLQTMYFQMVMLALVQRASVLRFSIEVTSLSGLQDKPELLSPEIAGLHKKYIRFVNKVYFREITAQEQGIELYNILAEKMRIHSEVKDLDNEIEELYRYVNNTETNKSNKMLEKLNILVAIFIIPTLIMGFYGMNIFTKGDAEQGINGNYFYWILASLLVLAIPIVLFLFNVFKMKHLRKVWLNAYIIFLIVLGLIILILPVLNN